MAERKRILVIEEYDPLRNLYKKFLKEEGYDVEVSINGQTALTRIEDKNLPAVDLILVEDSDKGKISGESLLLRAEESKGIPGILTLRYKEPDECQVKVCFKKPFNFFELLEEIKRLTN